MSVLSPGNLSTWQGFWDHVSPVALAVICLPMPRELIYPYAYLYYPVYSVFNSPHYSLVVMILGWIWLLSPANEIRDCMPSFLGHTHFRYHHLPRTTNN